MIEMGSLFNNTHRKITLIVTIAKDKSCIRDNSKHYYLFYEM